MAFESARPRELPDRKGTMKKAIFPFPRDPDWKTGRGDRGLSALNIRKKHQKIAG